MNLTGANTLMGLEKGRFDGHAHVFRSDLPMVEGRRYTPDYDATPEELCVLLDQHGIDGALLVQPSFLGSDNSYLLETLSSHPDRTFMGVIVLDPDQRPDPARLQDMAGMGVIGIRLNLLRRAETFLYDDWRPLLSATERLGWHIELHCEADHLRSILPALVANHGKVVVDHFGLVADIDNCSGLATILEQPRERLWIKASATYRIDPLAAVDAQTSHAAKLRGIYADHLGTDRLVWGSDWPFTQFEDTATYEQVAATA